jgi:cytochrome d ubiquinol oxidase subunit II
VVIGAISSDTLLINDGVSENGFLRTWFQPFPLVVGLLSLSLFTYLSACYLTVETADTELQDDFRTRALVSGFVSIMAAFAAYIVAGNSAQVILDGLSGSLSGWLVETGAAGAALVGFQGLWSRSYLRARVAAAAQVALIVIGWGIAQYPYVVRPELTIFNCASPINILSDLEVAVAVGAVILIPSLILLFLIFKTERKSRAAQLHIEPLTGPSTTENS